MVFTSFVSLVSLRMNPCVTRQNPHSSRETHPNGDLLIHRLRGPPSPLEKAIHNRSINQNLNKKEEHGRVFLFLCIIRLFPLF